jgi:hypothetical protein
MLYRSFRTAFFRAAWGAIALALTFLMAHSFTAHSHAGEKGGVELILKKAAPNYLEVGLQVWLEVLTLDLGTEHLSHFFSEKSQNKAELSKLKKQKESPKRAKLSHLQNYQQRLALQKAYWTWVGKTAAVALFVKNAPLFEAVFTIYFSANCSKIVLSASKAYFFSLQDCFGKRTWIGRAPPCIF